MQAIFHSLLFPAEADGLADKEARDGAVRDIRPQPEGFAVGEAVDAVGIGEAKALPHETVHMELSAGPKAETKNDVIPRARTAFRISIPSRPGSIQSRTTWLKGSVFSKSKVC